MRFSWTFRPPLGLTDRFFGLIWACLTEQRTWGWYGRWSGSAAHPHARLLIRVPAEGAQALHSRAEPLSQVPFECELDDQGADQHQARDHRDRQRAFPFDQ